MPNGPAWKDDFPVSWVDDDFVTRREFTRSLVWVSCAGFATTAALRAGMAEPGADAPFPAVEVAGIDDLPLGGSKAFRYPTSDDPCLLVRLDADTFAAFAQACTHLGCPVVYTPQTRALYCPCHEGAFDAADGRVVSGPPPRPLPRIALETRGRSLWAVGVRS